MELRVELRKGGLEAVVIPVAGPYEIQEVYDGVVRRLGELGAKQAVDPDGLRGALTQLIKPEALPEEIIVARGEPPQQGINAQILPLFPIRETTLEEGQDPFELYAKNVVYPGSVILEKSPPSPGIPGRSLLGVVLPAPTGLDIAVKAGPGVEENEDGTAFRATTYGVALFSKGRLQVVPALQVPDDRMQAHLCVLPDTRLDEPKQIAKVVEALQRLEVTNGVDREGLVSAIRKARSSGQAVHDVLAASGKEPVDGREVDYRLSLNVEKKVGKEMEGGRIDFREAESVKNVTKGEALAEVIPGTEPAPGFRVDGALLRPKLFRAEGLKPGQNTVVSQDGQKILADASGMLVIQAGKFHIVDQYLVAGDVDYRTGNIHATGAVTVRGQVKPGFKVESEKSVEIMGDVEEALVRANEGAVIRGGLTANSTLLVEGGASIKYILNSKVEAKGDVEVKLSITNSSIYTNGRVLAVGSQGLIMGGEVNAALGVEVRNVGSPAAKTHLAVGVDLRVLRDLEAIDKECDEIAQSMQQIQSHLGPRFLQNPRAALEAIPPPLRRPKLEMLKKIKELYQRKADLDAQRDMLAMENQTLQKAEIVIQGEAHAGTTLTICTGKMVLPELARRVVFYFDSQQGKIAARKL